MTSRCDHSRWQASSFLTHSMLTSHAASCPLPPGSANFIHFYLSPVPQIVAVFLLQSVALSTLANSPTTLCVGPRFVCQIYSRFFFFFSFFQNRKVFCVTKKILCTLAPAPISCGHTFILHNRRIPFPYYNHDLNKGRCTSRRVIFSLKHESYENPSDVAQARRRASSGFTVKVGNFLLSHWFFHSKH